MEKIILSKNISFCSGVNRTLKLIEKLLKGKKYKKIYMLGPVVHNEHVISDLKDKGLQLIKNFRQIPDIHNGVLVIQSHGVGQHIYDELNRRKIPYIDSTCTLVKYIHNSIKKLELEGYFPVIIGNRKHTEVHGIAGQVKRSLVISKPEEIKKEFFKKIKKIGIVFQSTFIKEKAEIILKRLKTLHLQMKTIDTICFPTKSRQKEVRENATKYKSIFIIGSRTSANTNHLFNIANKRNKNTFLIQGPEDIDQINFLSLLPCFVTSGASTPLHIIKQTVREISKQTNLFSLFAKKYIPAIDRSIKNYFQSRNKDFRIPEIKRLQKLLAEYCTRPGKRIRPLLLILAYMGFAKKLTPSDIKKIIKISAGIEMMHSFLLIHDDIIDHSELRRNKESCHVLCREQFQYYTYNNRIGEDIGLVLGDILFMDVICLIAQSRIPQRVIIRFLEAFSKCYELTGWGQILDSLSSQSKKLKKPSIDPLTISEYKTTYYTMYYPLLMGYLLSGNNNKTVVKQIRAVSMPLGLGFQIRDDILGIFGDMYKTGKSDTSDIEEGKLTILIQKTLNLLSRDKKKVFIKLFTKKNKNSTDIENIKNLIKGTGAYRQSLEEMNNQFTKAEKSLKMLKINKKEKYLLYDLISLLRDL